MHSPFLSKSVCSSSRHWLPWSDIWSVRRKIIGVLPRQQHQDGKRMKRSAVQFHSSAVPGRRARRDPKRGERNAKAKKGPREVTRKREQHLYVLPMMKTAKTRQPQTRARAKRAQTPNQQGKAKARHRNHTLSGKVHKPLACTPAATRDTYPKN